jgi:hypothetical protein
MSNVGYKKERPAAEAGRSDPIVVKTREKFFDETYCGFSNRTADSHPCESWRFSFPEFVAKHKELPALPFWIERFLAVPWP